VNYIETIAHQIREQLPGDAVPDDDAQPLLLLYALLALTKGERVSARDVHDAWSTWMTIRGEDDHDSVVEFDSLSRGTKHLDDPYVRAIRHVAQTLSPQGD